MRAMHWVHPKDRKSCEIDAVLRSVGGNRSIGDNNQCTLVWACVVD